MKQFIGVIPARYRSSRFPGKPLVDICGKPMLWWVYQQCMKVQEFSQVLVATDDERIREVCEHYHMQVMMTSETHETGSDRVAEVAEKIPGDIFVNIQGDEPLIDPEMIREVIHIFDDEDVYFGTLKKEITDEDEIQANSTVKVVTDIHGDALYFSRSVIPSNSKGGTRARVYRHVGIYAYTKEFLRKFHAMEQSELEIGEGIEPLRALYAGYKIRVHETQYDSIGVDYPKHVDIVENIIKKRGNSI